MNVIGIIALLVPFVVFFAYLFRNDTVTNGGPRKVVKSGPVYDFSTDPEY
jgi:hypothetical protein